MRILKQLYPTEKQLNIILRLGNFDENDRIFDALS